MLESREPHRTRDLRGHPRFRGWWPRGHPDMRSFLGVPIVAPTGVIGAFYLTEKLGGADFDPEDEELPAERDDDSNKRNVEPLVIDVRLPGADQGTATASTAPALCYRARACTYSTGAGH